jgi:hypothetical protein
MSASRFFLSGEPESVTANALGQVPSDPSGVDASSSSKTRPLIQVLDEHAGINQSLEKTIEESESDSDEPPLLMTSQQPLQDGAQELPSLMEQMMAEATKEIKEEAKKPTRKNSNGGMKKGFLLNSGRKKTKNKPTIKNAQANRISSVVTPTVSPSPMNSCVLSEVQEKRKDTNPLASPDLEEAVTSNPHLWRALQDPKFIGALHIIQTDPSKAKAIFKENPELISVFQEFSGVLGLHYSKLAESQQETVSVEKQTESLLKEVSTGMNNNRDLEQERAKKILADGELAELLMDPEMQRVMQECGVPGRMKAYMQHAEYGPKLRKLIEAGLLKVA